MTTSSETKHHGLRVFNVGVYLMLAFVAGIRRMLRSQKVPISPLTVTIIVPAHNEEEGLPATLEALLSQTVSPDEIIVVNDGSTDRTEEVASSYGVTVVTPPSNLGSKARAQNYALPFCTTDLVLPVDADTVLAPDYVQLIKEPFANPKVVIAAGCVQTRFDRTIWEKGRFIEYLFGFHFHRPIQNAAVSPVVCSGCCSAFRRETLAEFGGFPERTIVEDMDYTWTKQIGGEKAVYVADAVAYAADPDNLPYLRKQVWRWMSGFCQNVRIHYFGLLRKKKMLAVWISLALMEILMVPLWFGWPFISIFVFHKSALVTSLWWVGSEVACMLPPLIYATWKRKLSPWKVLKALPCVYPVRFVNFYYAWKAMIVELVLVPLGLSKGLLVYEKGRA